MARDLEIELRHFMLKVRDAGVDIELEDGKLMVRGNPERTDIYDEIRERKGQIVEAMTNLPHAVESYYIPRLEKGIAMLIDCLNRLGRHPEDRKLLDFLAEKIILWATVDEELRRIYPEYRGCPVGGCDTTGIPVRCMHCTESSPLKTWAEF